MTIILLTLMMPVFAFAQWVLPAEYTSQKDVVYKTIGDWQGRMDVYAPKKGKKHPLVINIHGGWVHGRKEDEKGFIF